MPVVPCCCHYSLHCLHNQDRQVNFYNWLLWEERQEGGGGGQLRTTVHRLPDYDMFINQIKAHESAKSARIGYNESAESAGRACSQSVYRTSISSASDSRRDWLAQGETAARQHTGAHMMSCKSITHALLWQLGR